MKTKKKPSEPKDNISKDIDKKSVEYKLDLWERMLKGDSEAIIELTILRGMAKPEDFQHE